MDNNLVRTDVVFGRRVNMIGNISADLVLESLGKIYIKSRNKSLTLEEVITSLVKGDPNTSTSRCKVVEGIEGLDTSEFKDGTFVFDKLSNILYLFIDDELLELINVAPEGTGFVKRSGDTMTGRLAIYVKNGPPLYVNSTDLVQNLNAQYLNGETADDFTRRNADEKIGGSWTFQRPTTFESGVEFYKDIITHGSIGTPSFSSGFGGYGWRMDADTNTLTVDNLVVRKLMLVYELVVNKISATNGSLWVTNAGKVTSVIKLEIKQSNFFSLENTDYIKFAKGLKQGDAFIKLGNIQIRNFEQDGFGTENEPFMTASGSGVYVKLNCLTVLSLKNAKLIMINNNETDYSSLLFNSDPPETYNEVSLFDELFKFDCTFPIVIRDDFTTYREARNNIIELNNKLVVLLGLADPTAEQQQEIETCLNSISEYEENANPYKYIKYVLPYYKYFANGDYYLVGFDSDELPVFKPGDLIRCQKWTYNGIKYYDAVVCNLIDSRYVIQLADSILDKKTTITYDSSLEPTTVIHLDNINSTLYESSERVTNPVENPIGIVEEKDSLVLMGHLWNSLRQNAVYITSTDDGAPFMDVMSGINRPDFSVIYYTPIFQTLKLYTKAKGSRRFRENNLNISTDNIEGIPSTTNYYILNNNTTTADYTYVKVTGNNSVEYYMIRGYHPNIICSDNGYSCTILNYLNLSPDRNSILILESDNYYILLEDGGHLNWEISNPQQEGHLLQESIADKLQLASTRTTRARFGNLDGIQDEMFPLDKLPYGYGLYGLNVFLTGEFYLSNGQAVADIGKEAITFAIAGQEALGSSIELLRKDTDAAYNLLKNNVYSKGKLRTAGMQISDEENPGIVLWGNKIIIATTTEEFYGLADPTALFAEGKILAKFLEIHDAYSDVKYIYEPINSKYSKRKNEDDNEWTFILYSAYGGNTSPRVRDTSNPLNTGGVKIYTDSLGNTKYIRRFLISRFLNNITDSDMKNGTFPDSALTDYEAWIEVGLDGDIPDITDIKYVTFEIEGLLYDGTTLENLLYPSVFNVEADKVNEVLKDLTLWSLRSDGSGNIGGKSVYWNTDGDIKIDSELNSLRGSIGNLEYYKGDLYFNLLESNHAYIESKYPKFLVHDSKLESSILLVSYDETQVSWGTTQYLLTQAAHSLLESDSLYIRKGHSNDCITINTLEGLIYEKENHASMGVSYPLVNLLIIPYDTNLGLRFYTRCNYIPQISGISVYYLSEGLYYFIINCDNSAFSMFLNDNFRQGNINISATGIGKIFEGARSSSYYFGDTSHKVCASINAANLCDLRTGYMGDNAAMPINVGGGDWVRAELTKTLVGSNNVIAPLPMSAVLVRIDSSLMALRIETSNDSGRTEGGINLLITYNYFLDNTIPVILPINALSYELDKLIEWIKEPYTLLYTDFVTRYNSILGIPTNGNYPEGSLGYYITNTEGINSETNSGDIIISNIPGNNSLTIPYSGNEGSSLLSILNTLFNNITDTTIKSTTGINNYIDGLTDTTVTQDTYTTFTRYVSNTVNGIYSLIANDEGLASSDNYTMYIMLLRLSPILNISPILSSFKVPNTQSVTLKDIAENLRAFVERECLYMNKFLSFLETLKYNIANSKVPDVTSVNPTVLTATSSAGTSYLQVEVKNGITWSIRNSAKWCYVGVSDGQGGIVNSNISGTGTSLLVEIRYGINNTYDDRTAKITILGGDTSIDVLFTQESMLYLANPTLEVNLSSINIPAAGGSIPVIVTSNTSWAVRGYSTWTNIDTKSGGSGSTTINISANSSDYRQSTITITTDDFSVVQVITVTQGNSGSGLSDPQPSSGDISYNYYPNATYKYAVINNGVVTESSTASPLFTEDIILDSSNSLGTKLYSVGLISDTHLSLLNYTETGNDLTYDEDDLINVLNIFKNDSSVKFIATCGDMAECWPYDSGNTFAYNQTYPLKDDTRTFKAVYSQYGYSNGLRIFSPLGNHDHLGIKISVAACVGNTSSTSGNHYNFDSLDQCDASRHNESSEYGYNKTVKDRIDNLWIPNILLNTVDSNSRTTEEVHYFRYNGYPDGFSYSTDDIDDISGWNTSRGTLNSYSKLSYWIEKTVNNNKQIYIMLSVDYGDDTAPTGGKSYRKWSLNARNIISNVSTSSDPYIKRMYDYVQNSGYSSYDENYNYQLYHPNTLIWLKEIIENNTSAKIFVFTHHFMPNRVGGSGIIDSSANDYLSGLPSNGAWAYQAIYAKYHYQGESSPSSTEDTSKTPEGATTLCGIEFWFVNKLMNTYSNVIWFSGHSHISWRVTSSGVSLSSMKATHITNNDYNIVSPSLSTSTTKYYNKVYSRSSHTVKSSGTGYFIALPSLSKPRSVNSSGYALEGAWSDFGIMDIYEHGVQLKAYSLTRDASNSGSSTWTEGDSGETSGEVTPSTDTTLSSGQIKIVLTNRMLETAIFAGNIKFIIQERAALGVASEADFCFRNEREYSGDGSDGYIVYGNNGDGTYTAKNPGYGYGVNTERLLLGQSMTLIYTKCYEQHSSSQITFRENVSDLFNYHFTLDSGSDFKIKLAAGLDRSSDAATTNRLDTATAYYNLRFTDASGNALSGNPVIEDKGIYYVSIISHGSLYDSNWNLVPYEAPSSSLDIVSEDIVKVIYNQ